MDIRKIIKEEIDDFDWVSQHMETVPDDPHHLALAKCYGSDVLIGMEQEPSYDHYGIDVYENEDGEEYGVGDTSQFWEALREYYDNLFDEVGVEGWNVDVESYMWMSDTDIRFWASDMADNDIEAYDESEIIERSSYSDEKDEIDEKIVELEDVISQKEEDMLPLDEDSDEYSELQEELEMLQDELNELESRKNNIYDDARQELYDDLYETHKNGLDSDPVDYLVNELGLYGSADELWDNNIVQFDREQFTNDLADEGHYGEISSYDGDYCMEHIDGEDYICIRIN